MQANEAAWRSPRCKPTRETVERERHEARLKNREKDEAQRKKQDPHPLNGTMQEVADSHAARVVTAQREQGRLVAERDAGIQGHQREMEQLIAISKRQLCVA
jgi:hypothetical protein